MKVSQDTAHGRGTAERLRRILDRLGRMGVVPEAAEALGETLSETAVTLGADMLDDIAAFWDSGNPDIQPELERHVGDHVREVHRLFAGGDPGGFDFVEHHAQRRATQRFPLEAMLDACRRLQAGLRRWLADATAALGADVREEARSAIAEFVAEYTHAVGTIAASAYVAQTRRLAEAEGDQRTELLSVLLDGYDESDGRVARLLKRAGYLEQRQSYCVVLAQSTNPAEMESRARAQRIVDAIGDALADAAVRTLAGIRGSMVVAVISAGRRQSGWTAVEASLASRLHDLMQLLGPAVLIGISADHPSTSFVPQALQEATVALDFAGVDHRVVSFSHLPVRGLLVHRGADYVRSVPPIWIEALVEMDARAGGSLIQTLDAIADADINIQKAARKLGRHPNTIYARIERIRDLTGLDGQRYHDLTELLLALACHKN